MSRHAIPTLAALAALVAPGAAVGGPIDRAGTVSGAHWSYHGSSDIRYLVTEFRPAGGPSPCSLARRQVPRLSRMSNGSAAIRLGSQTFYCVRHRPTGVCLTERGGFRWRPAT